VGHPRVRIALGQIDVTVGDLHGNVARMTEWARRATGAGADLIAFPELAVTGYPPEDLVLRRAFVDANLEALDALAAATAGGCAVVVGFVDRSDRGLHNASAVLEGGRVAARYHKVRLPNYGVFDEARTFVPGLSSCTFGVNTQEMGMSICEDAWGPGMPWTDYARARVPVILNINGSPYHRGKAGERIEVCRARAAETGAWIVYVNMVGGQDELVFDGGSMVVAPDGTVVRRAAMFEEDLMLVDLPADSADEADEAGEPVDRDADWPTEPEDVYRALTLGLGDYARKNGFRDVAIGLSGGVDSAFVACLAADALGPHAVRVVAMPSAYSSPESLQDAHDVARRIGADLTEIPINHVFDAFLHALAGVFEGTKPGVAEENLQARIRGNYLMAISNRFGSLVLATGNKSEYAVGYATLYGDMSGGLAPIKDVPKTLVYELCRWRNAQAEAAGRTPPIPERVMTKPPSAELRPGQKDTDSLPPYEVLDPIIEAYVEDDRSPEDLEADGFDPEVVRRVVRMIDRSEYKRRQAAPGIKITPKAFGRDRRLPITNAFWSDS
jgi:NAD+ synthase (glutamine-hydrolysing)